MFPRRKKEVSQEVTRGRTAEVMHGPARSAVRENRRRKLAAERRVAATQKDACGPAAAAEV